MAKAIGMMVIGILLLVLVGGVAVAASPHYSVDRGVMSSAGDEQESQNYRLVDVVGEAVIGTSASAGFSLRSGYSLATPAATNVPPVASDQSVTTDEDTAVNITLTGTDADGDALAFSVVSGPAHGILSGTAPNLTYTPDADYNEPDSFTFVVNDGQADSNVATVTITVNAVNDAPVADGQSVTSNEDTAVNITLTGSDADGDALAFVVMSGPAHGTLSGTAPDLTYTPDGDYNGPDSFTFVVNDGQADSNVATVSITIAPVADVGTFTFVFSSPNPSVYGQRVTLVALVLPEVWDSGMPTGTVTFKDGDTTIATGTLNSWGMASCTTTSLSVGSHSITAVYNGTPDFNGSTSSVLSQKVNKAKTSVKVTSSANPSVSGQSVTFTATVLANDPGSGTPTGTVTFKDGSRILGTGTLDDSGQVTFTTNSLSVGTHQITAVYAGDDNYAGSTSPVLSQKVKWT